MPRGESFPRLPSVPDEREFLAITFRVGARKLVPIRDWRSRLLSDDWSIERSEYRKESEMEFLSDFIWPNVLKPGDTARVCDISSSSSKNRSDSEISTEKSNESSSRIGDRYFFRRVLSSGFFTLASTFTAPYFLCVPPPSVGDFDVNFIKSPLSSSLDGAASAIERFLRRDFKLSALGGATTGRSPVECARLFFVLIAAGLVAIKSVSLSIPPSWVIAMLTTLPKSMLLKSMASVSDVFRGC
mmetsp:Transcript_33116/g.54682  ORF Transcript_33116/g.54682 Transcript_33116/m.54682 type:complete len:243 (+) Transcript_33116:841-1569(+)